MHAVRWTWFLGLLAVAFSAAPVRANTMLFAAGPTRLAGGMVDASASFTVGATGDIAIRIVNRQIDPVNVGQLISGLSFTLNDLATSSPSAAMLSSSAITIKVDKMGMIVETQGPAATDWLILPSGEARRFDLCTICNGTVGTDPDELLIGAPRTASGNYDSAMGSIAGNKPHNPFLLAYGLAPELMPVWTVRITGVTSSTSVTDVRFRFGTEWGGITTPGYELSSVPEPGTMALFAGGFAFIAAAARGQRKRKGRPPERSARIRLANS